MELIDLKWQGPYELRPTQGREAINVAKSRGIYLWTIGGPGTFRIAYVDHARNLRRRVSRDIIETLGGGRPLYEPETIASGESRQREYSAKANALVTEFIADLERKTSLALENLSVYSLFWTKVKAGRKVRETVTSAIVTEALSIGAPIQDKEPSLSPDQCDRTLIRSTLPEGLRIEGLEQELRFGTHAVLAQQEEGEDQENEI